MLLSMRQHARHVSRLHTRRHTHTPNPAIVLSFPLTHMRHTHTHQTQRALHTPTQTPTKPSKRSSLTQQAFSPFLVVAFSPYSKPSKRSPRFATRNPASVLPCFSPTGNPTRVLPFPLQAMLFGNDLRDPALQALRFLNIACRGERGIRAS